MPESYVELLDALIEHLAERKAEGERWVQVSPHLLVSLAGTPSSSDPKPLPAPLTDRPAVPTPAPPVNAAPPTTADRPIPSATALAPEAKAAAMATLRAQ